MREKFIEVYDNLIPNEIQDRIEYTSLLKIPWYYTANVGTPDSKHYEPAHSHFFLNLDPQNPPDSLTHEYSFLLLDILYKLANQENIHIETIYAGRLFMHLPSPNPSQDQTHTDLHYPHWVCLYYVTDSDGDTILFESDAKTELTRITPKKGRVVFFDGSIPHCSTKPSKSTRVIVNFDFKGHKFGKKKEN
tara:strand:- start:60 stop:632 length:573 start_codon:yes stop_codon:yes gene_type:complete